MRRVERYKYVPIAIVFRGAMISNEDYFRFAKERDTLHENVKALLERFPESRESYQILVNFYWYYVDGLHRFIPREVLKDLTSPEAITRTFRKVISDNPHLHPTAKTRKQREEQLSRYARYYSPKNRNYKEE